MGYQQDLEATLEAVSAHAAQVLEYVKSHPSPEIDDIGLPSDPLHTAPTSIQASRKRLTEASANLVVLGTRPQEYLEHLQNGVSTMTVV